MASPRTNPALAAANIGSNLASMLATKELAQARLDDRADARAANMFQFQAAQDAARRAQEQSNQLQQMQIRADSADRAVRSGENDFKKLALTMEHGLRQQELISKDRQAAFDGILRAKSVEADNQLKTLQIKSLENAMAKEALKPQLEDAYASYKGGTLRSRQYMNVVKGLQAQPGGHLLSGPAIQAATAANHWSERVYSLTNDGEPMTAEHVVEKIGSMNINNGLDVDEHQALALLYEEAGGLGIAAGDAEAGLKALDEHLSELADQGDPGNVYEKLRAQLRSDTAQGLVNRNKVMAIIERGALKPIRDPGVMEDYIRGRAKNQARKRIADARYPDWETSVKPEFVRFRNSLEKTDQILFARAHGVSPEDTINGALDTQTAAQVRKTVEKYMHDTRNRPGIGGLNVAALEYTQETLSNLAGVFTTGGTREVFDNFEEQYTIFQRDPNANTAEFMRSRDKAEKEALARTHPDHHDEIRSDFHLATFIDKTLAADFDNDTRSILAGAGLNMGRLDERLKAFTENPYDMDSITNLINQELTGQPITQIPPQNSGQQPAASIGFPGTTSQDPQ